MPSLGILACALVSLWLLATLAYQYSPVQVAIDRWDPFKLLPTWAFFAPHPAYHDYYLLVRELRRDATLGPLASISSPVDRRLMHLVWNPAKRPQKILQDAMQSIKRIRKWSTSDQVVRYSLPYLLLLHYVTTQYACSLDAIAVQFMVVETSGRDGNRIWISFVSGFHRVAQRSAPSSSNTT
jgi:hypothetical protein